MKPYRSNRFRSATLVPLSLLMSMSATHAATQTWDGLTDLIWSTSIDNWDSGTGWVNDNDAVFGTTGPGNISIAAGGVSAHSLTFNASRILQGNTLILTGTTPSIDTATSVDVTISSILEGSAGLIKTGAGKLTLNGANTYSGGTTLSNGLLYLGGTSGTALGTGDLTMATADAYTAYTKGVYLDSNQTSGVSHFKSTTYYNYVRTNGYEWTVKGLDGETFGVIENGGHSKYQNTSGKLKIDVADGGYFSYAGVMRNADTNGGSGSLSLTKSGAGTQTLSGTNIGYTGATTVNAGTLKLVNTTAFASPTTINTSGTLQLANMTGTSTLATVSLNGGTLSYVASSSFAILNGLVTASAASIINIAPTAGSFNDLFFDGGMTGSTAITLNNSTNGSGLAYRYNVGSYSGTLTVNGNASTTATAASGLAVSGCSTALQNANLTVNGTLELGAGVASSMGWANVATNGLDFKMGALNGTGVVIGNMNTGGSTRSITVGNTNIAGTFSGVVANGSNDTLSFTKTGNATQTLSGVNTYSGATTVNAGKLTIATSGTINSTSEVKIGAGEFNYNSNTALSKGVSFSGLVSGILSGTGTITPGVTVTSGNTYTPGATDGVETQTLSGGITFNSGSIFSWNIHDTSSSTAEFDQVNANALAGAGNAIFKIVLGSGDSLADEFWNSSRSWSASEVFGTNNANANLASIFTSTETSNYFNVNPTQGSFSFTSNGSTNNTLTWTAVPEPTSGLAGMLLGAGLLRRRRGARESISTGH